MPLGALRRGCCFRLAYSWVWIPAFGSER